MIRKIVVEYLTDNEIRKRFNNAEEIIEDTGWWFGDGRIVVRRSNDKFYDFGVMVHEFIEFLLEKGFDIEHEVAHEVAEVFESQFKRFLDEYFECPFEGDNNVVRISEKDKQIRGTI